MLYLDIEATQIASMEACEALDRSARIVERDAPHDEDRSAEFDP